MSRLGSNSVTYVTMAGCTALSRSGKMICHLLMDGHGRMRRDMKDQGGANK